MKWLLLIIVLVSINELSAQHSFQIELGKLKGMKGSLEIFRKDHVVTDSLDRIYRLSTMPNAFVKKLPVPKLYGNNGKGHDIYILSIDNMPVIKPDSTYVSKMPVAVFRLSNSQNIP